MKKYIIIAGIVFATGVLLQNCSSISLNPKRIACEEVCAQAKQKCIDEGKAGEGKAAACNVAHDQCIQKCASEFP